MMYARSCVFHVTILTALLLSGLQVFSAGAVAASSPSRGCDIYAVPVRALARALFDTPANIEAIESLYPLNASARAQLLANGFIVLEDYGFENISECYMGLFSKSNISVFITTDVMLHLFHVTYENLMREVEARYLRNTTAALVEGMEQRTMTLYDDITPASMRVKEAARRNVMMFAVASRLLNDSAAVPSYVQDKVNGYVNNIIAHNVTEFYPGDDYTQYEPRGHYAGDETFERYFRCMKWLGRRILRVWDDNDPEAAHVELIQAAMLAQILTEDRTLMALWDTVYNATALLVGVADSITPPMMQVAVTNVFGALDISALEGEANISLLRAELNSSAYPTSQLVPVPTAYLGQMARRYVQFMGERYTPDGMAFQKTTCPNVGGRPLPKGLDVAAAILGFDRAYTHLQPEMNLHHGLRTQLDALRAEFDGHPTSNWTRNIYINWLYTLRPLLEPATQGQPAFMQTEAWLDEKLNTALASWTQSRHDNLATAGGDPSAFPNEVSQFRGPKQRAERVARSAYLPWGITGGVQPSEPLDILYAKQTYVPAPLAEGYGYVEPIPEFYARLAALCAKLRAELNAAGVLPTSYGNALEWLANKLEQFEGYAAKELDAQALTEEEQGYIHGFGPELLAFFSGWYGLEEEAPGLIADVCSDSNTARVLHGGVGRFNPMIVIYEEPDGTCLGGIGYVMSYYERITENWTRLTDDEWRAAVEDGAVEVDRPGWSSSFLYPAPTTNRPPQFIGFPETLYVINNVTAWLELAPFIYDPDDALSSLVSTTNITSSADGITTHTNHTLEVLFDGPARIVAVLLGVTDGHTLTSIPIKIYIRPQGAPIWRPLPVLYAKEDHNITATSENVIYLNDYVTDLDTSNTDLDFHIYSQTDEKINVTLYEQGAKDLVLVSIEPDHYGYNTVTVNVSDGEHGASATFLVIVVPENDEPVYLGGLQSASIYYGDTWQVDLDDHFSDVESDYALEFDCNYQDIAIDRDNVATWAPEVGARNLTGVVFTATDPEGLNATSEPINLSATPWIDIPPRYVGGLVDAELDLASDPPEIWHVDLDDHFYDPDTPGLSYWSNKVDINISAQTHIAVWTPHEDSSELIDVIFYASDGSPQIARSTPIALTLRRKPHAEIIEMIPQVAIEGDTVRFEGRGRTGTFYEIDAYYWWSSIDGELSTQRAFSSEELSVGEHIIYFKVHSTNGLWSDETNTTLAIHDIAIASQTSGRIPYVETMAAIALPLIAVVLFVMVAKRDKLAELKEKLAMRWHDVEDAKDEDKDDDETRKPRA